MNINPKPITKEEVWRSGEGRTPPSESEIRSFNSRAADTRELSLRNLKEYRKQTIQAYTAKFGSSPDALAQAFDAASEYVSALPLIWWYKGTAKGSVAPLNTTGRGMFQIASATVPAIKAHMDVVRGVVDGMQ